MLLEIRYLLFQNIRAKINITLLMIIFVFQLKDIFDYFDFR